MKTTAVLLCALLLCLAAACGSEDAGVLPDASSQGTSSASANPSPESQPSSASHDGVRESAKLIQVTDTGATAVIEGRELVTFPLPEAVTYEPGLEGGLKPGMTVEITYDGGILETYPGQITAGALHATGYDDGLISLYYEVLEDLYGENGDGLNEECLYFGFDLTAADGLTSEEQQALGWIFAGSHGCTPLYGTIEELGAEGYIDMENLCWEDGLHFEIKASDISEDSFTLECTKWRSGLGACGYKLSAEKKDGIWTAAETGEYWVS